jgi:hypothetical protein
MLLQLCEERVCQPSAHLSVCSSSLARGNSEGSKSTSIEILIANKYDPTCRTELSAALALLSSASAVIYHHSRQDIDMLAAVSALHTSLS